MKKVINEFNGLELFNGGFQLLNNGKYVNANELKITGETKTIKNITEEDDAITLNFTDNTNETFWNRENPKELINELKAAEAKHNYINNHGEWYDFEFICFNGIATKDQIEKNVKNALAIHCTAEIEKAEKKIAELKKYMQTMNDYLTFAEN